jgi:hypothetical protein
MKLRNSVWLQKEKLQLNVDQLENLQQQHQKEKLLEKLQLKKQLQREKQLQKEKQLKDDNLVGTLTIVLMTTNCFHFSDSKTVLTVEHLVKKIVMNIIFIFLKHYTTCL